MLVVLLVVPWVSSAEPSTQLAITHVTVIDATGRPPQLNQTVLIEAGHIAAVGASATIKVPKSAKRFLNNS